MVTDGQETWLPYWTEALLVAWLQRMVAYSTAQQPVERRSTYKSWIMYEFVDKRVGAAGYNESLLWDVRNTMGFGWSPSHV